MTSREPDGLLVEPKAGQSEGDFLRDAIAAVPLSMVLADPRREDTPITYVNDAFERVTLYSRDFTIGRNCRFLQGEDTSDETVAKIREGIAAERDVSVDILNYKADGTPFRNRLMLSPIHDEGGELIAFLGVQRELPRGVGDAIIESRAASLRPDEDVMLAEVQHRVKNHLAMIVSMIRLRAQQQVSRKSFEALSSRIESLALLYDELSGSGIGNRRDDEVPVGAYLSRVCATLNALDGRGSIRVNVECDQVRLPPDTAARLGLVLTEFLTNALEHAFEGRDEGTIRVRFHEVAGGCRLMVEDDGVGLPEGSNWPWSTERLSGSDGARAEEDGARNSGLGGKIITGLASALKGQLDVRSTMAGTIVCLDIRE